jgi:sarcosine oxidase/L-pipecolate oxidase
MSMLANGTIKFNCDLCFTNFVKHPATGERMSVVPDEDALQVWTGPKFINFFQEKARRTFQGLYGKEVDGIEIEKYRMCWYV